MCSLALNKINMKTVPIINIHLGKTPVEREKNYENSHKTKSSTLLLCSCHSSVISYGTRAGSVLRSKTTRELTESSKLKMAARFFFSHVKKQNVQNVWYFYVWTLNCFSPVLPYFFFVYGENTRKYLLTRI